MRNCYGIGMYCFIVGMHIGKSLNKGRKHGEKNLSLHVM